MIYLLVYYLSCRICYSNVKFIVHDVGNRLIIVRKKDVIPRLSLQIEIIHLAHK
jgi:hypothetical protein